LNDKKAPVFVVATSNNIKSMPPELLRAGRFDGVWFVSLPAVDERKQIFEIHLKKVKRDPSIFDLDKLSSKTENFSGAEIEQIIKNSLYRAYKNGLPDITTEVILEAASEIVPLYITAKEHLKEIYEWVGFAPKRKDGIRARFVSSKAINKYEEDKVKIGFSPSRIGFIDDVTEGKGKVKEVEKKKVGF
jgi:SpoVK/Ycf46/Vps4 family AAA+-type ATPase